MLAGVLEVNGDYAFQPISVDDELGGYFGAWVNGNGSNGQLLVLGQADRDPLPALWQHPDLVALHDPARLPLPCRSCAELRDCGGGSRHEALEATGDLHGADPLAR